MAENEQSMNSAGQIALDLVLNKKPFETAMRGMDKVAAKAGKALGSALSSGASMTARAAGITVRAGKAFGSAMINATGIMQRSERSITAAGKKIAAALGGAFVISRIVGFAKACLDLGSDLEEVQNVVDVTFGSMSKDIDQWATDAMAQFGLSETKAKQYTSTMGAMLKSMGFGTEAAAGMSKEMAGLAADMASFYNLDPDEAFGKIRAGISGETEPLKQLGVNLSEVNLQEFALAQNMGKAYSKMTQQEKALVRYNYLLSVTADAQGDFSRTSGGWANQVRVLGLQFESLKASLGQGLINILSPVVKWLNAIVGRLVTAANAFKAFTNLLAGKKGSETANNANQTASGLNNAANAAGELTNQTTAAGNAARKTAKEMKALFGFDQINKLSDSSGSDTGGGGGGDPSTDYDAEDFDFSDDIEDIGEELDSKLKQLIDDHDWEGVGQEIAGKINKGLQFIYDAVKWETVGPKITPFADGIVGVFNGLIDPEKGIDFELLGSTIGAGINTMVASINLILKGIEWVNLGTGLAKEANGLVDEVDAEAIGELLGNKFNAVWNTALGFVDTFVWADLGAKIAAGINKYFETAEFEAKVTALSHFLNGLFTALGQTAEDVHWDDIGKKVKSAINLYFKEFAWEENTTNLTKFLNGLLTAFGTVAAGIDFESIGQSIKSSINLFFKEFDWETHSGNISKFLGNLWTAFDGIMKDLDWEGIGEAAGTIIKNYFKNNPLSLKVKTATDFLNGLFDALDAANKTIDWGALSDDIVESLRTIIEDYDWVGNATKLNDFLTNLLDALKNAAAKTDWEALGKKIGDAIGAIDWGKHLATIGQIIWDVITGLFKGLCETETGKWGAAIGAAILLWKTNGVISGWASTIVGGLNTEIGSTGNVNLLASGLKGLVNLAVANPGVTAAIAVAGAGIAAAVVGAIKLDQADWDEALNGEGGLADQFAELIPSFRGALLEKDKQAIEAGLTETLTIAGVKYTVNLDTGNIFDDFGQVWDNLATLDTDWYVHMDAESQALFDEYSEAKDKRVKATIEGTSNDDYKKYFFGGDGSYNAIVNNAEKKVKASVFGTSNDDYKKYFFGGDGSYNAIVNNSQKTVLAKATGDADKSYLDRFSKDGSFTKLHGKEVQAKALGEVDSSFKDRFGKDGSYTKLGNKKVTATSKGETGQTYKDRFGKNGSYTKLGGKTVSATATGAKGNKWDEWYKAKTGKYTGLGNKDITARVGAEKLNSYDTIIDQYKGLSDKNVKAKISAEMTVVHDKTITVGRRKLEEIFGFASGGVIGKNRIMQFAAGGYSGRINHGTMLVAGEHGPEVMGKINGSTEILNRSQLASTMFASVTTAMMPLTNALRHATPALAMVGDSRQQIGLTEASVRQIVQEAGVTSGSTEVVSLLKEILRWILAMDPTMQVDGKEIGKIAINYINNQTRITGHTPIRLA